MKSFLIITISIFFFINPVHAEIWICKSDRYDQVKFEITDAEVIQTYPNNDGRTYKITIDTRKAGIGLFGEMSNKERQYDFDIFMEYESKTVKVRRPDRMFGRSGSYIDKDCIIYE